MATSLIHLDERAPSAAHSLGKWHLRCHPAAPCAQPRDERRTSVVSPGDLDEAIRTAIIIGDSAADDNVLGSPFEKIDAFSDGVIDGLTACGT